MSKKLNLHVPFLLGIFLIGLFYTNVSQAQYTNAYWDVNGTTAGQGGSQTFSSSGVYWTTNSVNATAATGGPTGGGLFALITGAAGTATLNNSGGYNINFGGTAGNVKQGGSYQAASVNFLSSGYNWWVDAGAARTITTTNGVNLNGNALTLSNGTTGVNSFTFDGPTSSTGSGINSSTAGATLTLKNNAAFTAGSSSFGVYVGGGGTVSANIAMNVEIGAGSRILLGSQSGSGATFNSAIVNNSASGVALDITNSSSGTVALNGVVSGANGLVLNNSSSGRILLSASNTYSGGTTLNNSGSGTITINNAAAFGTGTITSAGAITNYVRAEASGFNITNNVQINSGSTLRLNANNSGWNITSSGVIAGAGSMMFSNSGVNYYLTGTNNSFGGGVSVGNGTLYFNKLGSNGVNSSLGTSGTITVGGPSATTTGGLRWNGTTNETSDKTIVLAGTTGGLNLYAEGTADSILTINGNINSTGVGAKTLNFAGYSNNTLTLNGVINENGGANSVVIGTSQSGTVVLGNANNSFSGAIRITNSASSTLTVLSTANIGNSGANSALGRNGTINMAGTAASAITALKYTGAGETSDKVINFMSGNGAAILDQSGEGNLKFTSAMTATGVGAKAITLQGSTGGTGEIAGAISDLGGVTSLTKSGTGAWTLSGNNSNSGLTTVTAGTLTLSGNNSGAGGGVTLTAGTLNINNNNALGTGALSLGGTGATINNTSGSAVVNAVNQAWTWTDGLAFGSSTNTAANNLNLGTGVVTASSTRTIALAGTGTKLTMGAVNITSTSSSGRTITANGVGNTLEMGGLTLSASLTPVTVTLDGTANLNVTGAIVNGTTPGNGLIVTGTGTKTLSGNNTYTGATDFRNGTNIISGNNSAAVGNFIIAGSTGNKPVVRLDNVNGISSSSSLLGASGNAQLGTLDLRAAGDFSLNSYGTATVAGNNMAFMNSSGSQKTLTFTAANNYITTASTGGRTLYNDSANLLLDFNGNIEIGGASTASEATTFAGVGNYNVDGNLLDTGDGLTRTLRKQGDGTLTLRGSANSIRGSTLVEAGTLDLYGNLTASTSIGVSTAGTSANAGVRTASATLNVRNDASLLSSSTTTVWSRGNLIVNGTAGAVVVENNGLLGGEGTVGAVTLKSGSLLNPGNSPGMLTAASSKWEAGSTYNWEIDSNASSAEAGKNWDLFSVTTTLDLSALSLNSKMNLVLNSLSGFDLTSSTNREWVFAQAGSLVGAGGVVGTAFAAGANVTELFNINATAFNAGTPSLVTEWRVEVGSTGTTLNLMAVPEPSTGSMLGLGLAGLVVTRLLGRKSS